MARIKIDLPDTFSFSTNIPVRITDINIGGHVGNDTILSIIHEARIQFFTFYGYSELNMAGIGTIMSDVGIEFKNELFYGDTIKASVTATEFSRVSFEVYYKLEKSGQDGKMIPVVFAKTGIVCFDYTTKKIVPVPNEVKM
jgi:acyl-CoA thioesterase FadM